MTTVSFRNRCRYCERENQASSQRSDYHHYTNYPKTPYPESSSMTPFIRIDLSKSLVLGWGALRICKRIIEFYVCLLLFAATIAARSFCRFLRIPFLVLDQALLGSLVLFSWTLDQIRLLRSEPLARLVTCDCGAVYGYSSTRDELLSILPSLPVEIATEAVVGEVDMNGDEVQLRAKMANFIGLQGKEREDTGTAWTVLSFPPSPDETRFKEIDRKNTDNTEATQASDPFSRLDRRDTELTEDAATEPEECNTCGFPNGQNRESLAAEQGKDSGEVSSLELQRGTLNIHEPCDSLERSPNSTSKSRLSEHGGTMLCTASQMRNHRFWTTAFTNGSNKLHKHLIQPCTSCPTCERRQSLAESRSPRRVSHPGLRRKSSIDSSSFKSAKSSHSDDDPYSKATRWIRKYGKNGKRPVTDI